MLNDKHLAQINKLGKSSDRIRAEEATCFCVLGGDHMYSVSELQQDGRQKW